MLARATSAGPPYVTDDPQPTGYRQFEVYAFTAGTNADDGTTGVAGVDFNYGAVKNLQLTVVVPFEYDNPATGASATGLGNVEMAAKYRFLHQERNRVDLSVFPRIFLPSGSRDVGAPHTSFLLPLWLGKDWDAWSTFGGGGCVLNRGGDSRDFCLAGWAVTRQVRQDLQIGAEIYHQTADTQAGRPTTGLGAGFHYDLSENYHLIGSVGPGVQNAGATNRMSWYLAMLFTY